MFHTIFKISRRGFPNKTTLFSDKAAGFHLRSKNVILYVIDRILS
jgi:hypothetical protein